MTQNHRAPDALDNPRELDQLAHELNARTGAALDLPVTALDRCPVCACVRVVITADGLRCALCGVAA